MTDSFSNLSLAPTLARAVAEMGYESMTPIQAQAIPVVLTGQDVMGAAQTGTGKTAAFVLPMIMKLKYAQGNDIRGLIVAPTRELAMQIEENVKAYSKYTDLRSFVTYGGLGPKTQIEELKKGVDILITTPGRFMDLYLEGHIVTKKLQILVLDEADKMMDMGFIGKIHRILEVVPRKRQNLLFSATMSDLVRKIAGDFLAFPTVIEVSEQATPAATVAQSLYFVPNLKTKLNLLQHFFKDDEAFSRVIVFCKTKVVADRIFSFLERKYAQDEVRVIHANKGQNTRINSMEAFKEGSVRMLVATDVAARGLDVSMVSHVINFDVPLIYEDYVHRIGRTGRAENEGKAITFINPAETYHFEKIEELIRMTVEELAIPEAVDVPATPFEEKQEYARELDRLRQRDNPDYKGAFHEKKAPPKKNIGKGEKVKAKKHSKKPNRNQLKTKNQKNRGK